MSSVNRVFLLGRLGNNPELRYTATENAKCSFSLATSERRKGQDGEWAEHTEWHKIVVFGKQAENCSTYLQKGRLAFIEGRIQSRKYQDQDGKDKYWTEIIANNVQFVGGKGDATEGPRQDPMQASPATAASQPNQSNNIIPLPSNEVVSFDDDDIPF